MPLIKGQDPHFLYLEIGMSKCNKFGRRTGSLHSFSDTSPLRKRHRSTDTSIETPTTRLSRNVSLASTRLRTKTDAITSRPRSAQTAVA